MNSRHHTLDHDPYSKVCDMPMLPKHAIDLSLKYKHCTYNYRTIHEINNEYLDCSH